MIRFPYAVGDRVRVRVDEPYGCSDLHRGDVVTVTDLGVKVEHDGRKIAVVFVETALGARILGLDAVEPADVPEYRPAERDEVVDGIFERIMRSDRELFTIAVDAAQHLPKVQPQDVPASEEAPGEIPEKVDWDDVGPADVVSLTDGFGDTLQVVYVEQECGEHGREAAFIFAIEDSEEVVIPADALRPFVAWLIDRLKHSHRDE